ncbi:MAG TPA: alkaline phosphatase family protein [Gemmatimonadales bacterium]|nr:alkaline phosphatase family protein [Gemmatimonadales bacterium]
MSKTWRVLAGALSASLLACSDLTDSLASVRPEDSGLEHIIIVTMENRSFDHLLGWLPGADGKQAGLIYTDTAGNPHPTHHLTDFQGCGFNDPDHSFEGARVEYNGGAADGWLRAGTNDVFAIGYYVASDLPFLGKAAPEWTVLDRYFAPLLGPTNPNRLILQAGQTDRLSNTQPITTLPAIWDRFAAAGVSGKNYGYTFVTASQWGTTYAAVAQPLTSFFSDAATGKLPQVAYVDPDYGRPYSDSYHPFSDIQRAEAFLASIYQAVTSSSQWSSSLLIITFDEWGGFFDHVPPPVAPIPPGELAAGNVDGLRGFRVPTLLISPFARRQHVSSTVYDHASILKLIEWRWNLQPLTVRDSTVNNLGEELDFAHPRTSAPVIDVPVGPFLGRCP